MPMFIGFGSQARELSVHANDPPQNKLPIAAQQMRTWSLGQVKMHVSNDKPFEAEEFTALRVQSQPAFACRRWADRG